MESFYKSVTFRKKNQNTPIITKVLKKCHLSLKKSKYAYNTVILKGDTFSNWVSPFVTKGDKFQIVDYYRCFKGDTKGDTFLRGYIFVPNCLNCCWLGWRHRFFFSSHIWFFLACEEKQARKKNVREWANGEKNEKRRGKNEH